MDMNFPFRKSREFLDQMRNISFLRKILLTEDVMHACHCGILACILCQVFSYFLLRLLFRYLISDPVPRRPASLKIIRMNIRHNPEVTSLNSVRVNV